MLLFVEAHTKPAREDAAVLQAQEDGYRVVATHEHERTSTVVMRGAR